MHCAKNLKDNKDNSPHLERKNARIFVLGHYLFLVAHSFPWASFSENCSLLGTDNVRGQISEHIFTPNGDYCLCIQRPTVSLKRTGQYSEQRKTWGKLQWATKVLRHLVIKLNFWASWSHFPPSPQNNVAFSISSTAQTTAPTQHWIVGLVVSELLTLEANKIEQMLTYRKASFPKSVSTTFVTHFSTRVDI